MEITSLISSANQLTDVYTQQANTCLNSTIETLEKGIKYVRSLRKRHENGATLMISF